MIPIVVVCGPTATGKTRLSVEICKKHDAEVISADSMQVYKGMDIGTAKPDKQEKGGVRHHVMSVVEPWERFSVSKYCELAKSAAKDIHKRKKLAVLVGGTGLYIDSLIDNVKFFDIPNDYEYREYLQTLGQGKGAKALWDMLFEIDKDEAGNLSVNDQKRVIRALEIFHTTGRTKTYFNERSKEEPSEFLPLFIGLKYKDRSLLYEKIHARVDKMVTDGLVSEVKALLLEERFLKSTGYYAIGYKEIIEYLNKQATLDTAVDKIKQATTRYSKRQMTWFNKNSKINWICIDEYDDFSLVVDAAKRLVEGFLKCET